MRAALLAATLLVAVAPRAILAAEPVRPVVVELFTSEGCSSCPPADALLTELAGRPDILPLAFHVTYWNSLGWRDPFSLEAATARQRGYQSISSQGGSYTPQMVIEGHIDAIGSDRPAVVHALASGAPAPGPALRLRRDGGRVTVEVGAGVGGQVLLVGFDARHVTAVGRGENAGRTLVESNVVRGIAPLGAWDGTARRWTVPAPSGERVAVLVQAADGRMLGAAVAP